MALEDCACGGLAYGHVLAVRVDHATWTAWHEQGPTATARIRDAIRDAIGTPATPPPARDRDAALALAENLVRQARRIRRIQDGIAANGAYGGRSTSLRKHHMDRAGVPQWEQQVIQELQRQRKGLALRAARALRRAQDPKSQKSQKGSAQQHGENRPKQPPAPLVERKGPAQERRGRGHHGRRARG